MPFGASGQSSLPCSQNRKADRCTDVRGSLAWVRLAVLPENPGLFKPGL
jgi:hypothetical protein